MHRAPMALFISATLLLAPATGLLAQAPAAPPAEASTATDASSKKGDATKDVPKTDEEAMALAKLLIEAVKSKNWPLAAGILVMLALYAAERFGKVRQKVGKKLWPWVGAGFGIAASIAAGLMAGVDVMDAVVQGFIAGAAATGLWEMVGKHVLKSKKAPAA